MDSDSPILRATIDELRKTKRMAERAFEQLADGDLFFRLNPDQNSIYVIVQHLSGNLVSRWTDFLTTDGEKPDRDRDAEFAEPAAPIPREHVLALRERGWSRFLGTLEGLTDADLGRTVYGAIVRATAHAAYYVGQIMLLAKHVRGTAWRYLTIPRGQSQQFNQGKGMTDPAGAAPPANPDSGGV